MTAVGEVNTDAEEMAIAGLVQHPERDDRWALLSPDLFHGRNRRLADALWALRDGGQVPDRTGFNVALRAGLEAATVAELVTRYDVTDLIFPDIVRALHHADAKRRLRIALEQGRRLLEELDPGRFSTDVAEWVQSIPAPMTPTLPESNSRFEAIPLSRLPDTGPAVDWIWHGYLARGAITELVGLWKAGKTTLISWLLTTMDPNAGEETFCGRSIAPGPVIMVSEESESIWKERRDRLHLGDHVRVLSRPFVGRPSLVEWRTMLTDVARQVERDRVSWVGIDSLPNQWGVVSENDNAEVAGALMPLYAITKAGAAVLLLHHPGKSDATEGRASRGAGSLPGFVDILLELRRYDPSREGETRRIVKGLSRYEDTPPELVLDYDRITGYRAIGTQALARRTDRRDIILGLLETKPEGMTVKVMLDAWPTGDDAPARPAIRTLRDDLENAYAAGGVLSRTGDGVKGDGYVYSITAGNGPAGSLPESKHSITAGSGPLGPESKPAPNRIDVEVIS